jgi:hypothetical protein
MSWNAQTWRVVAGVGVLALLVLIGVLLVPPYVENWKLQRFLNDLHDDPATAQKPADLLRANVVNKAGELGLPVHSDDIRVSREGDELHIEVLYVVHIDMAMYSVDLHFRPAS